MYKKIRKRIVEIVLAFIRALSVLVMLNLGYAVLGYAAEIKIAWDPNTEEDLAGYKVYYGKAPWTFGEPIDVENLTSFTLTDLVKGETYYIAVTAYDKDGNESGFSNQVSGKAHGVLHGEWVLNISFGDKGGVILRFNDDDNTFKGYGISDGLNYFRVEGIYSYQEEAPALSGTYQANDFYDHSSLFSSGNILGKIDRNRGALTIDMGGEEPGAYVARMTGKKVLKDPTVPGDFLPGDWTAKISGRFRATVDPFELKGYSVDGDNGLHLFMFSEPNIPTHAGLINLDGLFILIPANKAYGVYEISGDFAERGFFSGSFIRKLTGFNFSLKSENGNRYTIQGKVK